MKTILKVFGFIFLGIFLLVTMLSTLLLGIEHIKYQSYFWGILLLLITACCVFIMIVFIWMKVDEVIKELDSVTNDEPLDHQVNLQNHEELI